MQGAFGGCKAYRSSLRSLPVSMYILWPQTVGQSYCCVALQACGMKMATGGKCKQCGKLFGQLKRTAGQPSDTA